MTSLMSSSLLPLLVLVVGCYCAPSRVAGGFDLGGRSELDLALGGRGEIKRDGLAFSGDGSGIIGAKWKGTGQAGGYGAFNDHYVGGRALGSSTLGGFVKPRFAGAFGIDSKGNIPLAFQPSVGIDGEAGIGGNGELVTGDDASRFAALYYGDTGRLTEENNKIY